MESLVPANPGPDEDEVFMFRSWPGKSATGWRAGLAGGDSGSPSFVRGRHGKLELVGINTFSTGPGQPGSFIAGGGGIVLAPHAEWIRSVLSEAPEPASKKLFGIGLAIALAAAGLLLRGRARQGQ